MIWEDLEKLCIPYMVIEYSPRLWWPGRKKRRTHYEVLAPSVFDLSGMGFRREKWPRRYRGRLVYRRLTQGEVSGFIEMGYLPTLCNRHGCIWDIGGLKRYMARGEGAGVKTGRI